MKIHALTGAPGADLARALAEFESRFTYPLGPGRSFRISHGQDYPRFFRAMGPATCFVAEKEGAVIGVVGVAIRPLLVSDGSQRDVAYVGDLKVDPGLRGSIVFVRLAQAALAWGRARVNAAYGIVMDGTRASPTSYTGRVGIPSFLQIGKTLVLRVAADAGGTFDDPADWIVDADQGEECYRALSSGRYAARGGEPQQRSTLAPLWLVHPGGLACGRLEDTLAAKRLIDNEGSEMLGAHLACAAWMTPQAGAELIHMARLFTARQELPALFTAVDELDMPELDEALGPVEKVMAPATIFGVGLPDGPAWNINTSEI
jgi:hypothetical protein